MQDSRPTPEEMLERAAREAESTGRARLKIFFGMAPGVGKTFAMLEAARARRAEGVDVVVGWVETHGRRETEQLLEGLPRLEPRIVEYRGVTLREFDLDAALARPPGLLLVDELAHTNAEGSRHSHRWRDVEDLLAAGIDVHTTLNVQHLESLNDVIAIITGVAVTETVPDTIFDRADEIELVDLPPDDLLRRMREGKVYVPAQAERALQNFFRKGNLIALRELALRRAAERVELQAAEWKRGEGVARSWPTRERILVAVGPAPQSAALVRAAFRIATRLRAPWTAVSVETPKFERLSDTDRRRLDSHMTLAASLGAETLTVRGEKPSDEVLAIARERNATRIVVGKPGRRRWPWRPTLVDDLVREAQHFDVIVTAGDDDDQPPRQPERPAPRVEPRPREALVAIGIVAGCTLVCWWTQPWFELADQAMLYLLGVMLAAGRLSRRPAFFTAVASVAALDFFFVEPRFTFAVNDLRHIVTFLVMGIVGLTVSRFAIRVREQAGAARERERRTAALFTMSRDFASETEVEEIAATAVFQVRALLGTDAAVLVARPDGVLSARGGESDWIHSERELAVARWVYEHGRPAGRGTETLPLSETLCLPLSGSRRPLGTLAIRAEQLASSPTLAQRQLLETYAAQTALALERALFAEETARARIDAETERTRSSLLSLVSHDLRTPLASITGATEALLRDVHSKLPRQQRELIETVHDEAERLRSLVANLLELTRLESGMARVAKEWLPFEEIASSAIARVEPLLTGREIRTDLPDDMMLLVPVDALLIEQLLVNLIENAAKYSPAGSPIDLRATLASGVVHVEVSDHGAGITPGDEERIFEKFYRGGDGTRARGTGLGLAVCQAIVRAHSGEISAANRPEGGAVFRFTLPLEGAPPKPDSDLVEKDAEHA